MSSTADTSSLCHAETAEDADWEEQDSQNDPNDGVILSDDPLY